MKTYTGFKGWIKGLLLLVAVLVFGHAEAQIIVSGNLCTLPAGQASTGNPPRPGGGTGGGTGLTSCASDSTAFSDSLQSQATAWLWNFGDPASGVANTSTLANPKHAYTRPGPYTVQLIRTLRTGVQQTVIRNIVIGESPGPFPNWRTDTTLCGGQKITLDPYDKSTPPPGAKYLWYPKGDTTRTIQVDSSGCYSVQVYLPGGCSYEDRINVQVCGERPVQQGAKWHFGTNAGLDFMGGAPTALDDSKINTIEGSSSISNTKGKLLFYTDGITVFDADGARMRSSDPAQDTVRLAGSQRSTQSALIVPQPTCRGCEYLYYIYTTTEINGRKQLSYSVVDMRLNRGKGQIVQKNVLLADSTTERLAAVKNERDTTFWLITRDFGSNKFRVYHMTDETPNQKPKEKVYEFGPSQTVPSQGEGALKIGPADSSGNGNRPVAMLVPGPPRNYLELYTFNDSTGVMTQGPRIDLGPAPPRAYGVEFAPGGKQVYVSFLGGKDSTSMILKYDITKLDSTAIVQSRTVVDSTSQRQYGALQVGSDGRIYVAIKDSRTLGVITNPDDDIREGGFQYTHRGVDLGNGRSQLGLPSFVTNFTSQSSGPGFSYQDTCSRQPTTFTASPLCPPLKHRYRWDFGTGTFTTPSEQQERTHTFNQPGTYTVRLGITALQADGTPCKDTVITQTLTIIETPQPFDLGGPIDRCKARDTLTINTQAQSYEWRRLNGRLFRRGKTIVVTPRDLQGINTLIGVAYNGECEQVDTLQITLVSPPLLELPSDTTVCKGTRLELVARGSGNYQEFRWSTGVTSATLVVDQAGEYILNAISRLGGRVCENSDTIRVSTARSLVLEPTITIAKCSVPNSGAIRMNNREVSAPDSQLQFTWRDSVAVVGSDRSLSGIGPGRYFFEARDRNGCVFRDTVNVGVDTTGFVNLGADRGKCLGDTIVLRSLVPRSAGDVFAWSNGRTTDTIAVSVSGVYRLRVTNPLTGCRGSDEIKIDFSAPPVVNPGPSVYVCLDGNPQPIRLTGAMPAGGFWRGPGVDSSGLFRPDSSMLVRPVALEYRVTVNGCESRPARRTVFVNPRPTINLGSFPPICPDPLFQIGGTRQPGLSYRWSTGDTTASIRPRQPGSYRLTVSVTEDPQCQAESSVQLSFLPLPVYSLTKEVPLCVEDQQPGNPYGRPAELRVTGGSGVNFLWISPASLNGTTAPSVRVTEARTDYIVQITGANGCIVRDTARVVDKCEPRVFVPDAFTPNGDNSNDQLDVFTAYVSDFELRIFNRWGEVIFQSTDPEKKWDGTYRGEPYPPMVYTYMVSYKSRDFPDRPKTVKRGSIMLIR